MEQALLVSNAALWIAVLVLAIAVAALVRQIGILYERVAPAGALVTGAGPRVGEAAPVFELADLSGETVAIGGEAADGRSTLLFFLSPSCPICSTLLPVVLAIGREERARLRLVFASDGEPEAQRAFAAEKGLSDHSYVLSTRLGLAYQVGKLPHAVLIDERGRLAARGLVNSREHIESLFEAQAQGVASLQEYVEREQGKQAVA